jgi:hypothetical protein
MGIANINSYGNSSNLSNLASSLLSETSNSTPSLFDVLAGNDQQSNSSSNISDILDLSPQSQQVADQLNTALGNSLFSSISPSSDPATLASFQTAADRLRSDVQSKISELFKENGIDTSKEINLQLGSDGQVTVSNDNPQKAQIEQLFKDNPSLRAEYAQFTAISEIAAAGREAQTFQAAYAQDPSSAVAKYSYLFDSDNKGTLSLSIQGDKYQALFERADQDAVVVSTSE